MNIDWILVSRIAGPVIGAIVGAAAARYWIEREKLVAYYGHAATHTLNIEFDGNHFSRIGTHSLIIRNNGNRTATNVRISHNILPNIYIYPDTDYAINDLPNGGKELLIPQITPKRDYTISYLYLPPLTCSQITVTIESEIGPAKIIDVRLQQVFPKWVSFLFGASAGIGLAAIMFTIVELGKHVLS